MTKKQAITKAQQMRKENKTVKVFYRSGVYCQPGRGLAAFGYYEVREVA